MTTSSSNVSPYTVLGLRMIGSAITIRRSVHTSKGNLKAVGLSLKAVSWRLVGRKKAIAILSFCKATGLLMEKWRLDSTWSRSFEGNASAISMTLEVVGKISKLGLLQYTGLFHTEFSLSLLLLCSTICSYQNTTVAQFPNFHHNLLKKILITSELIWISLSPSSETTFPLSFHAFILSPMLYFLWLTGQPVFLYFLLEGGWSGKFDFNSKTRSNSKLPARLASRQDVHSADRGTLHFPSSLTSVWRRWIEI